MDTASTTSAETSGSFSLNPRSIRTIKNTSNKLMNHIYNKDWPAALERLDRKPSDIRDKHLFVHIALQLLAPSSVIRKLGVARPDAFYHKDPSHGMLPLHLACQNGYSHETIEFILRQYPPAAKAACREGMLPLHLACASPKCQLAVVVALLGAFPEGMDERDSRGMTPLEHIQQQPPPNHPHLAKIQNEFERGQLCWHAKDIYDPRGNGTALCVCKRQWKEALARLERYPEEATIWTKHKNLRYLPIHYACKYKAPFHIVQELIDIHPFSLALTCQDFDMTALHLACQSNLGADVIRVLIDGHGDACSHEDALGLLPLHLACAAGASIAVIETLLQAYPQATLRKDVKGYPPHVYAEAASHPHSKQVVQLLETARRRISTAV